MESRARTPFAVAGADRAGRIGIHDLAAVARDQAADLEIGDVEGSDVSGRMRTRDEALVLSGEASEAGRAVAIVAGDGNARRAGNRAGRKGIGNDAVVRADQPAALRMGTNADRTGRAGLAGYARLGQHRNDGGALDGSVVRTDEPADVIEIARSCRAVYSSVSLTYIRMPRTIPFAAAVIDYQKHRVKKLKKQVHLQ